MKIYTEDEKTELRKQARRSLNVSVAEVADNWYGLTLYVSKKDSHLLRCYEHQSLVFDMKENEVFYKNNRSCGMTPYDFIADYEGISKLEARMKLDEYEKTRDEMNIHKYMYDEKKKEVVTFYGVLLPKRGMEEELRNILGNLSIHNSVIDKLIRESIAYEDENGDIVFIGYDNEEKVRYGIVQSMENLEKQIICEGSSNRGCIQLKQDENKETIIIQDILDALSLYSMQESYNVLCMPKEHVEDVIEKLKNDEWFKKQSIIRSEYGAMKIGNVSIETFDKAEWMERYANEKDIELSEEEKKELTLLEMVQKSEMHEQQEESCSI